MTFLEAVPILMSAAAREVAGTGRGIRHVLTATECVIVREAWIVAFQNVYRREPDEKDLFNVGL